jgi:release factor glutamine methyltransferase
MENKDKKVMSLGTNFEVLEEAPTAPAAAPAPAPAAAAPRPPAGAPSGPMPLRKSVSSGSIGLMIALAGLMSPYGAPHFEAIAALAIAFIVWDLASNGLGRVKPTSTPHKPIGPALAIIAGALGIAMKGENEFGMMGGILAILGGVLAIAAPAMGKGADSKLPPAAPDAPVDEQFSKSFLAYMLVLVSLPLAWSNGLVDGVATTSTGLATYLGVVTFLCCVLGLWASWSGMWKMWSMPAVTSGALGLILFLAPLEALLLGMVGVVRVVMGEDAVPMLANPWPGEGSQDFLQYGLPPLLTLVGGAYAGYELFHGAKKGLADNKAKQEAEVAARKAARAARRGDDPAEADKPEKADKADKKSKRAGAKDNMAGKGKKYVRQFHFEGPRRQDLFDAALRVLSQGKFEDPPWLARHLLSRCLGITRAALQLEPQLEVTDTEQQRFADWLQRFCAGEPLAYLEGSCGFYGREFQVDARVLVPRPDSESLIEAALDHLPTDQTLYIADVGAGSGCLLLTLLAELPEATGVAVDLSVEALQVTEQNRDALQLQERCELLQGSWLSPIAAEPKLDLVISNPPYIEPGEELGPGVAEFEPHMALFTEAGAALDPYLAILNQAKPRLKRGGLLIFEVGAGRDEAVREAAIAAGFRWIETRKDLGGVPRAVVLRLAQA